MPVNGQYAELYRAGLQNVIFMSYKAKTDALENCVPEEATEKAFVEIGMAIGTKAATEKIRSQDMAFSSLTVRSPKMLPVQTFGLGVRVAMEDLEDDLYGVIKQMAMAVGESHKVASAVQRSLLFNCAGISVFRTGIDGKPLCTTTHTIIGDGLAYATTATNFTDIPTRSSSTPSNMTVGSTLDHATLADAVMAMRRTVTEEGEFAELRPTKLIVPPELDVTSWELTKSSERVSQRFADSGTYASGATRPGTVAANIFQTAYALERVIDPYLLQTDAWFLQAEKHSLRLYRKKKLELRKINVPSSWDFQVEGVQRMVAGFDDWRGVYGVF